MTRRSKPARTAFQTEGNRIHFAEIAAERLLERTQAEHNAVMALSRDELSALAQQMLAVVAIAKRDHLAKAAVGSIAPDAFPGPVE